MRNGNCVFDGSIRGRNVIIRSSIRYYANIMNYSSKLLRFRAPWTQITSVSGCSIKTVTSFLICRHAFDYSLDMSSLVKRWITGWKSDAATNADTLNSSKVTTVLQPKYSNYTVHYILEFGRCRCQPTRFQSEASWENQRQSGHSALATLHYLCTYGSNKALNCALQFLLII